MSHELHFSEIIPEPDYRIRCDRFISAVKVACTDPQFHLPYTTVQIVNVYDALMNAPNDPNVIQRHRKMAGNNEEEFRQLMEGSRQASDIADRMTATNALARVRVDDLQWGTDQAPILEHFESRIYLLADMYGGSIVATPESFVIPPDISVYSCTYLVHFIDTPVHSLPQNEDLP